MWAHTIQLHLWYYRMLPASDFNKQLFLWFCHMAVFYCWDHSERMWKLYFSIPKGGPRSTFWCINNVGRVSSTHVLLIRKGVHGSRSQLEGWHRYMISRFRCLLPFARFGAPTWNEFDLTNVFKLRVIENEFDVEDLELGHDGESEMAWGQKVHMPEYYFH